MKIQFNILFLLFSGIAFSQIIEGGEIEVVQIVPDKESKALIRKVIDKQNENMPEKQDFYQYNSYIKFLITTNRDSILNDRLYIPRKEEKKKQKGIVLGKDQEITMLDVLKKGHIFIGERAMEHYYSKEKGYKNIVKANRVAGLKSPLYEFAAMDVQSVNLKDPYFVFLGVKYINPISKAGLGKYRYQIIDTLNLRGRPTIEVKFRPIGDSIKKHLRGNVWIDKETLGVAQFNVNEASSKKPNEIVSEYQFKKGSWFPFKQYFKFDTGRYDYVAETLEKNKQGVIVLDTLSKSQPIRVLGNTYFNEFEINIPIDKKIFRGHESEVDSKAYNLTQEEWKYYRQGIELDEVEKSTYLNIDSIGEEVKVDRFLKYGRAALSGYYPIKMIDLDLTSLFNYNEYEGIRLGTGFKTNYKFDDRWQLEGNVAYGFKDHRWKYGLGMSYLVNKANYGIIGGRYFDDISPFGSQQFAMKSPYRDFRENLDRFHNEWFTKEKNGSIFYQHDFFNTATFKIKASRNHKEAAFDYRYENQSKFDFFDLELAVKWSPKSKFARTDYGKITLENNFPVFQLNTTQGLANLGGDFEYTKFDFKGQHQIENPIGKLNFQVNSGVVLGDVPLMNLYAGNGNSSLRNGVFKNFNIAGITSFETMGEREFFSDRFASFQMKQYFPPFKLFKKPIFTNLVYRGIIGDLDDKEKHSIYFNTLEDYYQEAGVEVNNLFLIFGLGSYYRFGAYHLNDQGENFSVKLTAKIDLF
ncbi:hypothetical protein UJ101_01178 [Flavobacteriaceae bacterium UJ101]|nr:hypothetical protein UJ101_01178 [Flavobacteriaceae bacterium UJ101]